MTSGCPAAARSSTARWIRGRTLSRGATGTASAIEPGSDPVLIVGRGAGTTEIVARHVVVALNAFLPSLLPAPPGFGAAVTLALCTEPVDLAALELAGGQGFYTEDTPYLWGRGLRDGRAIFGAGLARSRGLDPLAAHVDRSDVRALFQRLAGRVRGLHPALARARITHRWGGPVCWRAGRVPLLRAHPHVPRLYELGCFAGHGVALSVRIGRLLADAIATRRPLPKWGQ